MIYLYNIITTRSLLYYGSIVSKANLYIFGISRFTLPKIINTKFDDREDRRTQTLVFPKPKPNPFKKYYDRKCSHSTFSMPKGKTITQIRPDDQTKARERLKSKSNFGTYTLQIVF